MADKKIEVESQTKTQEQLRAYKQEALEWIKGKGIDPNSIKIQWSPEEATKY